MPMDASPPAAPPGVEVTGPAVPGSERVLTTEALAFVADLQRPFGSCAWTCCIAGTSGRRPWMPASGWTSWPHRRDPRGGLDRGPGTGRLRRPSGRDHRPGRAEDAHQRAEHRRARLHGRHRGRALPDLGQRAGGQTTLPTPSAARRLRRPRASATAGRARATLLVRHRGWHLTRRTSSWTASPSRPASSTSACTFHNAGERWPGVRGPYYYLPKLESHLEARLWNDVFVIGQDALGIPLGTHPRDRAHRDDLGGLRDGGDPPRAARARRGPQRRPLGLHLQHHQGLPRAARHGPARPRPADDGRALHARVCPAARARLPSPRRPRDRRDERVHPESARARGDRDRARRVREDKEREAATASMAPGSPIPTSYRSRRGVRRACSVAAAPEGPAAREVVGEPRPSSLT